MGREDKYLSKFASLVFNSTTCRDKCQQNELRRVC
jgi:hypothetical protein